MIKIIFAICFVFLVSETSNAFSYHSRQYAIANEAEAWLSESGTTSKLATGCGVITETMMYTSPGSNYLVVIVTNESDQPVYLDLVNSEFKFSSGIRRFPSFDRPPSYVKVEGYTALSQLLLFPSKDDFRNTTGFEFVLRTFAKAPKNSCSISTFHERKPEATESNDQISRNVFDISIGFGASLLRTGALNEFANEGLAMDLSLHGWGAGKNGGFLTLITDRLNANISGASLDPNATADPDPGIVIIALGYSRRDEISDKFDFHYDIGPAIAQFGYKVQNDSSIKQIGAFALMHKAELDYRITRVREGSWQGDYMIGLSAFQYWIPSKKVGTVDASGSTAGVLLSFKVGG